MKTFIYRAGDEASHKEVGRKLRDLPEGSYVVTVKRNRPIRSLGANRFYHAILNIIAIETGHTHEELHEAMKMKFNCKVIFFPKGGSQTVGNSTSDMDSAEFAGYLNRVVQWAQDEFGIIIPKREDITQAMEMDIENEYDNHFNG